MSPELIEKVRLALGTRQYKYRQTFNSPPGKEVLKDLARFCRANTSTFDADPRLHAVAEGRREVWLRIQDHLQMNTADLWTLYSGRDD